MYPPCHLKPTSYVIWNEVVAEIWAGRGGYQTPERREDRKSTRLNSSHLVISYAVFCLKKIKYSNGTHRHTRRFQILDLDIQLTLKQQRRYFIAISRNYAKASCMLNITSSVISQYRIRT